MTTPELTANAESLSSRLTGLIESIIEHEETPLHIMTALADALIASHERYPIINSEDWIKEWKERYKILLETTKAA